MVEYFLQTYILIVDVEVIYHQKHLVLLNIHLVLNFIITLSPFAEYYISIAIIWFLFIAHIDFPMYLILSYL